MKNITNIGKRINKFIYKHIEIFMSLAAVMSFFVNTLSYLSITFFVWNFFNKKAYPRVSFIFFTIAIGLNIYFLVDIRPDIEKFNKEWNQTGYDASWRKNAQSNINHLSRRVEKYKTNFGKYPDSLNEIPGAINLFNLDLSFRIKNKDGQVHGTHFYYEKIDSNHFFIGGLGKDGKIKTDDDIVPEITKVEEKLTGLIRYELKAETNDSIEFIDY